MPYLTTSSVELNNTANAPVLLLYCVLNRCFICGSVNPSNCKRSIDDCMFAVKIVTSKNANVSKKSKKSKSSSSISSFSRKFDI